MPSENAVWPKSIAEHRYLKQSGQKPSKKGFKAINCNVT